MSLLEDPFEDEHEYIGIDFSAAIPYLKTVGNVASAMFGQPQAGGAAGTSAAMLAPAAVQQAQMMQLAQMQQAQMQHEREVAAAKNRTLLLVGGTIAGLGLLGTLVYFLTRKSKGASK